MPYFLSDQLITFCIIAVYITMCTVREMYFVFETGNQMVSCNSVIARTQPNAMLFICPTAITLSVYGEKVPSTSSLSVYTKVLAHNLNDIRNWASLIGLLLRICWCLLSIFLIYCLDEWKKLVNLIYCFQVLFRMNFKIMYFLMKTLGNNPSTDSAASRDSLSSQNAT